MRSSLSFFLPFNRRKKRSRLFCSVVRWFFSARRKASMMRKYPDDIFVFVTWKLLSISARIVMRVEFFFTVFVYHDTVANLKSKVIAGWLKFLSNTEHDQCTSPDKITTFV